jgi:hypothetical protein
VFGLTVDRLDFDNKVVHVDRQITGSVAGRPTFGPLKTEAELSRGTAVDVHDQGPEGVHAQVPTGA